MDEEIQSNLNRIFTKLEELAAVGVAVAVFGQKLDNHIAQHHTPDDCPRMDRHEAANNHFYAKLGAWAAVCSALTVLAVHLFSK